MIDAKTAFKRSLDSKKELEKIDFTKKEQYKIEKIINKFLTKIKEASSFGYFNVVCFHESWTEGNLEEDTITKIIKYFEKYDYSVKYSKQEISWTIPFFNITQHVITHYFEISWDNQII